MLGKTTKGVLICISRNWQHILSVTRRAVHVSVNLKVGCRKNDTFHHLPPWRLYMLYFACVMWPWSEYSLDMWLSHLDITHAQLTLGLQHCTLHLNTCFAYAPADTHKREHTLRLWFSHLNACFICVLMVTLELELELWPPHLNTRVTALSALLAWKLTLYCVLGGFLLQTKAHPGIHCL
jgi:hypothetical protein